MLDIPYSSVISNKRKDFELALMGMTQEVKNARYSKPLQGEIYIERLIIEDRCWHIEIQQTYKLLPNQDSASTFGDPFRSFIWSLESWF